MRYVFIQYLKIKIMKKITLMAIAILFSGATVFGGNLPVKASSDTSKTKKVKPAEVQYTCGMHPDVISNKPGRCPKCGMELVQRDTTKKKTNKMNR
jgi:predicted RNA-binding Zn-ribbon protein involved in translation (DUF1610 family)